MRIIFVNLHCNALILNTFTALVSKKKVATRHRFLVDGLIQSGVDVINFITIEGTTLPPKDWVIKATNGMKWRKREADYVLKKNGLSSVKNVVEGGEFEFLYDDIVILYSHLSYIQCFSERIKGIKVMDYTHFYGDIDESVRIQKENPKYYLCEIDLNRFSKLYKKNFSWFEGGFIRRDYDYEPRFVSKTPFDERKNKICSMGFIATLKVNAKNHFEYANTYNT